MKKIFCCLFALLILAACTKDLPPSPGSPGMGVLGQATEAFAGFSEPESFFLTPDELVFSLGDIGKPLNMTVLGEQYVYAIGYVLDVPTNSWKQFKFDQPAIGSWIKGNASTMLSINLDELALNVNQIKDLYAIAYACTQKQEEWDCHENKWMIRDFKARLMGISVQPGESAVTPLKDVVCIDSDEGKDYSVYGTISGLNQDDTGIASANDGCAEWNGQADKAVHEFYCDADGKHIQSEIKLCEVGCANGACLPAPATAPVQSAVLASSLETNTTDENLIIELPEQLPVAINIIDWRVNGNSIAIRNFPFENHPNSAANVIDYSTNNAGNAGSISGAKLVSGKIGNAYSFDGISNAITFTNIRMPENGAVVFWWKPDEAVPSDHPLFTIRAPDSSFFDIYPYLDGILYAGWYKPSNDHRVQWPISGISIGEWHHIALTWRYGGETILYIDGVAKGSTLYLDAFSDTSSITAYLSAQSGGSYAKSTIDEFAIYDRPLSANQILLLSQGKNNIIHSDETTTGETWYGSVTFNDGTKDTETKVSNEILIK